MENFKEIFGKKSTRLFLLAILIILVIIVLMVLILGGSGSVTSTNIVNAAKNYYATYPSTLPKEKYESKTIMLSTLISSGYLSSKLDGATCPSYVIVTNMDGSYEYTPVLMCSNTTSTKLYSKVKSSTETTATGGLYQTNTGYIFKGSNPNNYVKFADSLWRIMSIDSEGNIKMIYSDIVLQDSFVAWDTRYNADFIYPNSNTDAGKNDYSVSNLRNYLDNLFSKYSEKFTGSRIARLISYDVCTGKATIGEGSNLCSTKVTTYASIITIKDYVNASLDKDCSTTNSKFCKNDNFLFSINNNCWTITANGENTYSAFYIDENEGITTSWAYMKHCTKPIVTLKNTALYVSGNGTEENPYQIG